MPIPPYMWLKDDGGAEIKGSVDVQDREGSIEIVGFSHGLNIPVVDPPGDFLILQANAFNMVNFVIRGKFAIRYTTVNPGYSDLLHKYRIIGHFLPCVVDTIPADLRAFKRLPRRDSFIEIRAGAIKLLFNHHRRM